MASNNHSSPTRNDTLARFIKTSLSAVVATIARPTMNLSPLLNGSLAEKMYAMIETKTDQEAR